jgi:hypothetical protein
MVLLFIIISYKFLCQDISKCNEAVVAVFKYQQQIIKEFSVKNEETKHLPAP